VTNNNTRNDKLHVCNTLIEHTVLCDKRWQQLFNGTNIVIDLSFSKYDQYTFYSNYIKCDTTIHLQIALAIGM